LSASRGRARTRGSAAGGCTCRSRTRTRTFFNLYACVATLPRPVRRKEIQIPPLHSFSIRILQFPFTSFSLRHRPRTDAVTCIPELAVCGEHTRGVRHHPGPEPRPNRARSAAKHHTAACRGIVIAKVPELRGVSVNVCFNQCQR